MKRVFTLLLIVLLAMPVIAFGQKGIDLVKANYVILQNKSTKASGGRLDTALVALDLRGLDTFAKAAGDSMAFIYLNVIGQEDTTAGGLDSLDHLRNILVDFIPAEGSNQLVGANSTTPLTIGSTYYPAFGNDTMLVTVNKSLQMKQFRIPATRFAYMRVRTTYADSAGVPDTGALRWNYVITGKYIEKR